MFDAYGLTLFLLPIAAASGWFAAKRFKRPEEARTVNADYLKGLSYLVSEESDKAIEVFTRLMEVDNETVETQLALGKLFRRQGEVDRALRIHQNLVARPNLAPVHRNQARFELARDYQSAGVLDRAENLYRDLVDQGMFLEMALDGLITIYEQEKDWQSAIDACHRLEAAKSRNLGKVIAQYHCELAEQHLRQKQYKVALKHLKSARSEDRRCARANILLGQLEIEHGNSRAALRHYQRVLKQNLDYAGEVLKPMEGCYSELNNLDAWRSQLEEIATIYHGAAPRLALAGLLIRENRQREAIDYLTATLHEEPNWTVFYQLLELSGQYGEDWSASLDQLRDSLRKMIETSPKYRCGHCGFSGRTLHWQCPSCRLWQTMLPLKDVSQAAG